MNDKLEKEKNNLLKRMNNPTIKNRITYIYSEINDLNIELGRVKSNITYMKCRENLDVLKISENLKIKEYLEACIKAYRDELKILKEA